MMQDNVFDERILLIRLAQGVQKRKTGAPAPVCRRAQSMPLKPTSAHMMAHISQLASIGTTFTTNSAPEHFGEPCSTLPLSSTLTVPPTPANKRQWMSTLIP